MIQLIKSIYSSILSIVSNKSDEKKTLTYIITTSIVFMFILFIMFFFIKVKFF